MPDPDPNTEKAIRETAYYLWEKEGRPEGRDQDHWVRAAKDLLATPAKPTKRKAAPKSARKTDHLEDEEKVIAGHPDVNMTALLVKDVPGG
jgi:hypothetical protein